MPAVVGVAAAPRIALRDCSVLDGAVPARCGTLRVPEDRAARNGRALALNLVVIPAERAGAASDPLFVIAGGPGQVGTALVEMVRLLAPVHRDRDLVFVDQRGTGGSNPLVCPPTPAPQLAEYGPSADARWDACLAALRQVAALRHYGTTDAAADLEAVRAALGYARVNLLGGSYGTRVAQEYLRRHPTRVRSAVLWATTPMDYRIPLDGGLAIQSAMERLLADCGSDAACAAAYPRLGARLDSLLLALARQPVRVTVPRGAGDSTTVVVDQGLFAQSLVTLLFNAAQVRRLPALVDRAARGDWTPVGRIGVQLLAGARSDPDGLYLAVVCGEDVPGMSRDRLAGFRGPLGAALRRSAEDLVHRCARWPRGRTPSDFHEPVRADAPVLLLTGAADPATPPHGGERVARALPNARHVSVPAASHGPIFPGCVRTLVAAFVTRPEPAALDARCVDELRWPPFTVPAAAAAPSAAPSP